MAGISNFKKNSLPSLKIISGKDGVFLVAGRDFKEGEIVVDQKNQAIYIGNMEKIKSMISSEQKFSKAIMYQFSEYVAAVSNLKAEDWNPIQHSCDPNL